MTLLFILHPLLLVPLYFFLMKHRKKEKKKKKKKKFRFRFVLLGG
jgi:hypothetical protein